MNRNGTYNRIYDDEGEIQEQSREVTNNPDQAFFKGGKVQHALKSAGPYLLKHREALRCGIILQNFFEKHAILKSDLTTALQEVVQTFTRNDEETIRLE